MTSTNLLKIHDQLHIDRQRFFALSDEDRSTLLQWSLAFKTEIFYPNDDGQLRLDNQSFEKIARKYRIRFKYHRDQAETRIDKIWRELFGVGYRVWEIDGHAIFESIEPFEIDRLEQVLSDSGNEFDKNRIKAGCQMARIMNCEDISQFAAVFEFTVRRLVSENDSAFQNFENNEDKQNEIKDSLDELIEKLCVPSDNQLSFVNDLVAANQFDKNPMVHEGNNLTPTEYIDLARKLASGKATDVQLTQEGSAFKCTFENNKALALRVDNVMNGTSVIATLYRKRLKSQQKDKGAKPAPRIIKVKKPNIDGSEN